jgi:hypothetical protein
MNSSDIKIVLEEYDGFKNMLTEYDVILRKLPIHSVTEHILSFISGFDDTIDNQIKKYKQAIIKPFITYNALSLMTHMSKFRIL